MINRTFKVMAIDRKFILAEARDVLIFAVASTAQAFFMCRRCNSTADYILVTSFTFLMWYLLWKGNSWLAHLISLRISWIKFPLKRFLVGVISTIVYTVLALVLSMKFFEAVFDFNFGKSYMFTIYIAVGITILISLFMHGREFLLFWRQASFEKEKFEKESAIAKYESLKNQVNPHFLFNSFNALSNLVYEDQDKAVKFIKQLSEVYRYVLDTRDKEVVPVADELKFLQSYLYLQQIRFGDKLRIENSLNDGGFYVAPLALQMLIENAIKHNVVSEDDPLIIKLFHQNGFIVVVNNIQKKTTLGEPSAGVGLENICKRYQFLSDRQVEVIEDDHQFVVKLPVLTEIKI